MRARRDEVALRTPLYLIQAADRAQPPMPRADAAKLMNHYIPHDTGGMHGILAMHLGVRVRLTELIDKRHGLVKDAEGTVVRVEADPRDQDAIDAASADRESRDIYLRYPPLCLWLRMHKYAIAPCGRILEEECPGQFASAQVNSLYFLAPITTSTPFEWRGYVVQRSGFPLTHAAVRTSTACQGKTMDAGVVVDCGRIETGSHPMKEDNWWLHLYVMLSRATSLEDLLLLRAPSVDFLLRDPPADLRARLEIFQRHADATRTRAGRLVQTLDSSAFLR